MDDKLVIEHREALKTSVLYLLVIAVLVAILFVAGDQFRISVGTVILLLALAIELGMMISSLITAFTKEILSPEGLTVSNVFGTKIYFWKDLERFEILWDYKGKRLVKKEEIDAPYILLKFANPRKTVRFDYLEAIDQCIRCNYGEPHKDDWTNIGK